MATKLYGDQINELLTWERFKARDPQVDTLGDRLSELLGITSIGRLTVVSSAHHLTPPGPANAKYLRRLIRESMGLVIPAREFYDGPDAICSGGNPRCIQPSHLIGAYDGSSERTINDYQRQLLLKDAKRAVTRMPTSFTPVGHLKFEHEQQIHEVDPRVKNQRDYILGLPFNDDYFIELAKNVAGARLSDWSIEYEDCWFLLKGNVPKFRRLLGELIGLYPAWTEKTSPQFDQERVDEGTSHIWIQPGCSFKSCWRPSHLIASYRGQFLV